jgi:acyl carrier protein
MDKERIQSDLASVFKDVFGRPIAIVPEMTADDVDEWDSICHVTLMVTIEQQFGFQFSLGEIDGLQNVGDLLNVIHEHLRDSVGS